MTTFLVRCRVADYDTWRAQYDKILQGASPIRSSQVWRGQDDPNYVVIAETYDSRADVEALLADPAIQDEMKVHGVDIATVQFDFLDDVGSVTRQAT